MIFIFNRNAKKLVFNLTASAAMVALSVVLTRFVGFAPEGTPFRFEIGFLPIAIIGYLFGPFYSAVAYGVADLIGSFTSGYAPFLPITLAQIASGAAFGLFFYKKKHSVLRSVVAFSAITAIIEILAKTPMLTALYGWELTSTFLLRIYNGLANLPIRVVLYFFTLKALEKPLSKYVFTKAKDTSASMNNFTQFANSFQAVTVPGLSRIASLLGKLGSPEKNLRCIHVAGTNGKGSVSAYISAILEDAGYKVGKYISPNLIKVNERISVNGEDIPDGELNEILSMIEPLAREVEAEEGLMPTQFEIWTAAAFYYFSKSGCDYVALEVGLGGELDATNVIQKNVCEIITRLGIDHKQYLGSTIAEIAKAKAGIIKKNSEIAVTVTVDQEPEALAVISEKCASLGKELIIPRPTPICAVGGREKFYLDTIGELTAGISGYHQIENASLAATAALKMGIAREHIISGIARAKNPARFEILSECPTVIYDGGHNENGICALMASVKRYFGNEPRVIVFACMRDKEIEESLKLLSEGDTEFIYTTVKNNPRASSAAELARKAEGLGFSGDSFEDIGEAYEAAISKNKTVIICGSLYLYKDLNEYLEAKKNTKVSKKVN